MTSARERSAPGPRAWRTGSREIGFDRPIIAGILNVTPDSFSDGGNFFTPQMALDHAAQILEDGVDIIDVGGESTRPGAKVVVTEVEIDRSVPVIRAIRQKFPNAFISIDTTKSAVAAASLEAGADIVNDVSAMRLDSGMADVVRDSGCGVVLMHSRGGVEDMASYAHANYIGDPVATIVAELAARAEAAEDNGVEHDQIVLDPGFGFSKRSVHSMELLSRLDRLVDVGYPVMAGVSRKRFVTEAMLEGDEAAPGKGAAALPIEDRDAGTVALNVVALMHGARVFRVHNVRANRRGLDAAWSLLRATGD